MKNRGVRRRRFQSRSGRVVNGLKRSAEWVVEPFVKQEDLVRVQPQFLQAPLKDLKGHRTQTTSEKCAEMVGAQVHFQHGYRMQREGKEAHGPKSVTDRARTLFGADHQGSAFAGGKGFLAVGTEGQVYNAVPLTTGGFTL
jgi:hypothetical protein